MDIRCPDVIKIGFDDDGIVSENLTRGHTMSRVIKITIINFGVVPRFKIGGI